MVKVLLRRDAATGFADVTTYARKEIADLPCHWEAEQESGDVGLNRHFVVRQRPAFEDISDESGGFTAAGKEL